jgi:hypothetical protein
LTIYDNNIFPGGAVAMSFDESAIHQSTITFGKPIIPWSLTSAEEALIVTTGLVEGPVIFNTTTKNLRVWYSLAWHDIGASYWNLVAGPALQPNASGLNVIPNGSSNLGDSGVAHWSNLYINGDISPPDATVGVNITDNGVYLRRVRTGSLYGIGFDTSSNDSAWRIYGATNNLILTRLLGTGIFQVNTAAQFGGNVGPDTIGYDCGSAIVPWFRTYSRSFICDSSVNNMIFDTSTDIYVQGNTGMFLTLFTAGGGIICQNASVFRSDVSNTVDLGSTSFYWKDLWLQGTVSSQTHRIFIQAAAPGSPTLNDIWIDI